MRWRRRLQSALTILAYHRVLPPVDAETFCFDIDLLSATPAEFDWQMRYIKRHMNPIGPRQLLAALAGRQELPPRAVMVTFDDGYDDCVLHALPILEPLGMEAVVFVSTGYIDSQQTFWFDRLAHAVLRTEATSLELPDISWSRRVPRDVPARRALYTELVNALKLVPELVRHATLEQVWQQVGIRWTAEHAKLSRPMSADDLAAASRRGLSVQSHTVTHPILSQVDDARLDTELVDSRERIAEITGEPAQIIAYPNGTWSDFGAREIAAAQRCGYLAGMAYESGVQYAGAIDPFRLLRLPVSSRQSRSWFRTMLALPTISP